MKIYAWTVIDGIAFFLPKEIDIGSTIYFFVLVKDDGIIKVQRTEASFTNRAAQTIEM